MIVIHCLAADPPLSISNYNRVHAHRTDTDAPQDQEEPTHVLALEDIREAFSGVSRDAEATVSGEWSRPTTTNTVSLNTVN